MKITYNWLQQFINIPWDVTKTAELLTDLGLEVEGTTPYESVKGGLKGIVVGEVLTCKPHPNADRLKITTVTIGQEQPLPIVCGAPNVAVGQKVAVATIGTTLYTEKGEAWKIKKGKIRGEKSFGMICSEDELGLGTSNEGILVLPQKTKIGIPLSQVFTVETDFVYDIGLTPNRADAMSHYGTARDLKAGFLQKGITIEFKTPSISAFHVDNQTLNISVTVKNPDLAPRYSGVSISNITVKESPQWLKNRLQAIGITPKNNVVDVTNYVMHELGQPLHAFDAAAITGNTIEVKTLKKGTKFTTLDDVERELHADDLMICDSEKPLCIAGVLGGKNSGVTNTTKHLFLESAYFNPVSIRKTAKRHGINSDASFRFERGIDPEITVYALKRAALLITDLAGGEISSDITDWYPKKIEAKQVLVTFEKINNTIGQTIPKETVKQIVTSLDIKIENITETGLGLSVPAYRNDVTRAIDVIEEILRVYGYNNIEITTKLNASIANTSKFEDYKIQNIIGNQLVSLGFFEILTNSLTTPNYSSYTNVLNKKERIALLNPLSSDLSVLRQTLLFSGLEAVAYNINHKQESIKFFEFGKIYTLKDTLREENQRLSLLISGPNTEETWTSNEQEISFFYIKGIAHQILDRLGFSKVKELPTQNAQFSEGLAIHYNNIPLVEFGLVATEISSKFQLEQEVFYIDFNWDNVLNSIATKNIIFTKIRKYPAVTRDFALLLDTSVTYASIYNLAKTTEKKLLTTITLFDVYTGKNLPQGKKSYAIRFTFQDTNKTLTDKQIDKIMKRLQSTFEKELGATLR